MKLDTISFSAIQDLERCPFYFKLRRIDHIYLDKSTIETIFGKLIHKCCQSILLTKNEEDNVLYFERAWDKFVYLYKKNISVNQGLFLKDCGLNILSNMKSVVDLYLRTSYDVFSVEEQLKQKALENYPQNFKAYIDIVFKQEEQYIISDFKTCSSIYFFQRYLNKEKERQLVLYKHYFSKKHCVDVKNIKTNYILLEKNPNSKNPVKVLEITSGNKKIQNHLNYLGKSLNIIQEPGIWPKNRLGCSAYGGTCVFHRSKYCS